ncbi:MAG: cardiolipin synthase [Roseobacter sp.]
MLTLMALGHASLVIGFTIRILLRDDLSPPARLAWFIVLNILPYFGIAVYFLFGEVDIGHRQTNRHKHIFQEIKKSAGALMGSQKISDKLIDQAYSPAFRYAASINGFHPMPGNTAELMGTADETLKRMIQDIDAAEDHVHVLYYIWLDDHTGTALSDALIRATARGVTCRAMADGLGSRKLVGSKLWKRMKDAGVQLAVSMPLDNPIRTILTSRIDMRNHRKITVIDGLVTYCGSRNSADPEFRLKPKYAPWVDIMLRFKGPVVAQNQLLFICDWMAATGEKLVAMPSGDASNHKGFPASVVGDGPTVRRGATPQLFSSLVSCARHDITISTPYFVPDATLFEALCSAAHRGVKITLIFPARNDSWVVAAASHSYYRRLLEAGCQIHEFEGGLLHAKTFTMDEKILVIGSTNLDLRSFDLNYENNILLQDRTMTLEVQKRQQDYIASARAVKLSEVLAWSAPRRIWNNIVATVGPIL